MSASLVIARESSRLHDVQIPEGTDRITSVLDAIEQENLAPHLEMIDATLASNDDAALTHSKDYVEDFQESCLSGKSEIEYTSIPQTFDIRTKALCYSNARHQNFDLPLNFGNQLRQFRKSAAGDTPIVRSSYQAALLSAGSVISAIKSIESGEQKRAFCLNRPPGHHAEWEVAMGFCYFNNIAVGAQYLLNYGLANRIAILDFDVHHGNGTQHLFYDSDKVFVCNIHRDTSDFYPYICGYPEEEGYGAGKGYNLNIPLAAGSNQSDYFWAFKQAFSKLEAFQPDWLLVSAGFDAHKHDPLGGMQLESSSYFQFAKSLREFADTHCEGRMISVLEGGYNRKALGESICAYLNGII